MNRKAYNRTYSILLIIGGIVFGQLLFLLVLRPLPFWDELKTIEAAIRMQEDTGHNLSAELPYFSYYGNNYPFIIIVSLLCRLFGLLGITEFWPWLLGFNMVIIDVAISLYSYLLLCLRGKEAMFAFLFVTLLNPFTFICAGFVYTTTWSILLISLEICLLVVLLHCSNTHIILSLVISGIFGFVVVFAAYIRMVSLIPIIAALICFIIRTCVGDNGVIIHSEKNTRVIKYDVLIAFSSGLLCFVIMSNAINHYVPEEVRAGNFPFTHWIMMSFNEETDGEFSLEDEALTANLSQDERKLITTEILKSRIHTLSSEGKLIPFLIRKLNKTWSKSWRSVVDIIDNCQNYGRLYSFLAGGRSSLFRSYYQVFFAGLYLSVILCTFQNIRYGKIDYLFLLLALSLLGGVLFHLIWEAHGLYSISYYSFANMLCALWVSETTTEKRNSAIAAKPQYTNKYRLVKPLLLLLTIGLPIYIGGSLRFYKQGVRHDGWTVNSDMRSELFEYKIDRFSQQHTEMRQYFKVKRGFAFDTIELAADLHSLRSRGYIFALYNINNDLLYEQILSADSFTKRDASMFYKPIDLKQSFGEGEYYFTISLADVTAENAEFSSREQYPYEFMTFFYRRCDKINYYPNGYLLIDNCEPQEGRSNLEFNVFQNVT